MKGFRYRLDPVLLVRQWELLDAQSALGEANARLAQQESALQAAERRYRVASDEWSGLVSGPGLPADEFGRRVAYLSELAVRLKSEKEELARLLEERDAVAVRVAVERRAVDAFEEHRAKAKAHFVRDRMGALAKDADDHWSTLQGKKGTDEHNV